MSLLKISLSAPASITSLLFEILKLSFFISVFFGSSLIIETIFSLDGLGRLGFEAAVSRDYPVVFGTLYIFGLLGLVVGLLSDLMYVWVDPRIDFEKRQS